MLKSLSSRLVLAYSLVVLLVSVAIAAAAYRSLEYTLFSQMQSEMMQTLHVFSGRLGKLENNAELRSSLSELAKSIGGRALVLNNLGRVVADSLDEGSLVGKVVVLDEIPDAISGKSVSALYEVQRGRLFYAAVPVVRANKVEGVLFGATRMDALGRTTERFARLLARELLAVLLLALGVVVLVAYALGRPWTSLVKVVETAPAADYRHRIPARGMTELARLARGFNLMADRLQRTRQARRDFVVEASNELEIPLRTILGVVSQEEHDPVSRLNIVLQTARSMSVTVEQLLDLARLEIDNDPLTVGKVELGNIFSEIVERESEAAMVLGVKLTREDKVTTPVEILGDRKRLIAAVSGLVRFSVAIAGEGGYVHAAISEDQNNAFFAIDSSGPGVPQEEVALIFERFMVRVQNSGGDFMPERTGAGMAIARRVIELHGGAIEAKSAASGGVTFFGRLPKKGLS